MKNQILIVFDSLRWDVFKRASAPFLKGLGRWKKAYTPGNYTLPAHMSFFAGKLPQTFDRTDLYDTVATRIRRGRRLPRGNQLWRLGNPEAPRPAHLTLEGSNIIEGFRALGYLTLGTGAVNWFNPELPAARCLTEPFEKFAFFEGPEHAAPTSAEGQLEWVSECLSRDDRPYFLFINFGETHHRFNFTGCPWDQQIDPYGDGAECRRRQRRCLEYLDGLLREFLQDPDACDLVICSDHGEALGEAGLWGHGFHHPTVLEVPLLVRLGGGGPR